jgi:hypothetical protein
VAQVPDGKPHLRHGPPPPAPWTATTCAMDRHHLRPEPPSPAPGTTVTCAGNNHHFRHCCRNWSEQPTGNELVGVVLSLGAGIGSCWCRCLAFLAQVWKKGGDLRQRSAREAISRRRSRAENHTCARNHRHLRPQLPSPAPQTATPGSRRGILRRSRGWRGGRCGCRRSSGR